MQTRINPNSSKMLNKRTDITKQSTFLHIENQPSLIHETTKTGTREGPSTSQLGERTDADKELDEEAQNRVLHWIEKERERDCMELSVRNL